MLSIKTKVKFKRQLNNINYKKNKIMRYILKPLFRLEDKIYTWKQMRIKRKVENIDEDLFIYLLVKNHILKDLIKYSNDKIIFSYEYDFKGDSVLEYTRNLKNNVLKQWIGNMCNKINFIEEKKLNKRLVHKLKKELKKHPEIKYYDYQRDKYCHKILVIKFKE